jgi:hypothetical protein
MLAETANLYAALIPAATDTIDHVATLPAQAGDPATTTLPVTASSTAQ